jgi:hypothetical protein
MAPVSLHEGAPAMAQDDRIDRTALIFVVLTAIFLLVLTYTIFPRHEAGSSSPAATQQKK